jgi:hypothetical protein
VPAFREWREFIMRRMIILSLVIVNVLVLFAIVDNAAAWKIQPVSSNTDKFDLWIKTLNNNATEQLAELFATAQHEEIAHRIFGCEGADCRYPQPGIQKSAPAAILAGVRWNDTPPLTLPTGLLPAGKVLTITDDPEHWGVLFRNARKQAEAGVKFGNAPLTPVLYRSHFGDMQFLHSMASEEKEPAGQTKRKILAWSGFMYKLALGEINPGTSIRKTGLRDIDSLFANRDENVQTLFVSQAPWEYQADEDLHLFAMGVLIHMVSDSFPDSHVERDETRGEECQNVRGKSKPGRIRSFHVYVQQDISAHSKAESDGQLAYRMADLIDVNRTLMEYYYRKAPWDALKAYLDCIYDLADPDAPSGPGSTYRKKEVPIAEPKMTP